MVLTFWLFNVVVIVATAFGGSYIFARGISLFAGGFPSSFLIIELLKHGVSIVTKWFYVYLALIVITTVGGSYFQFK